MEFRKEFKFEDIVMNNSLFLAVTKTENCKGERIHTNSVLKQIISLKNEKVQNN